MIRISVEVGGGPTSFRVSVMAESIERALEVAQGQNPGKECNVTFPIEPEAFFVMEESVAKNESLGVMAA